MKLTGRQIFGFMIAIILIIAASVVLINGYEREWGWFLGLGFLSFIITITPEDIIP